MARATHSERAGTAFASGSTTMQPHVEHSPPNPRSAWTVAAIACLLMAAAYVVILHWQHVLPVVPVVILLLCPLIHLFHHRGHRHAS